MALVVLRQSIPIDIGGMLLHLVGWNDVNDDGGVDADADVNSNVCAWGCCSWVAVGQAIGRCSVLFVVVCRWEICRAIFGAHHF